MSVSYDSFMGAFGYHPQDPKPKDYDRSLVVTDPTERRCFFTGSACMTCLSAVPERPHELPLSTQQGSNFNLWECSATIQTLLFMARFQIPDQWFRVITDR